MTCSIRTSAALKRAAREWPKAIILLLCGLFVAACNPSTPATTGVSEARRIVSTAPSLTEILYALELGSNIVGVTPYCAYPPEAADQPQVGDLYQPNYEAMLSQQPTHAVVFEENAAVADRLEALDIETVRVRHETLADIVSSIEIIGKAFDRMEPAATLASSMRQAFAPDQNQRKHRAVPVLLSIGRTPGAGHLESVYVAGRDNYLDELLMLAGGSNVYNGPVPYPMISTEGVMQMNPEVIIDLIPSRLAASLDTDPRDDWNVAAGVPAVRDRRIYVLTNSYVFIPGPRLVHALNDFRRCIQDPNDRTVE